MARLRNGSFPLWLKLAIFGLFLLLLLIVLFIGANVNAAFDNCMQIEDIKEQLRADAERRYNNREVTYKALNLKPTPELEALALESRDQVLNRFQEDACQYRFNPIPSGEEGG